MKILLDILPILIFVFGGVIFLFSTQSLRKDIKRLKESKQKLLDEIENTKKQYKELSDLNSNLIKDIETNTKAKQVAIQMAAEASSATDRLLASEQERLRAEINGKEQLELERMEQRLKEKDTALVLLYEKKQTELDSYYCRRKAAIESELLEQQEKLDEFKKIQDSVNEAILRNKELKEKSDFYSLQVSDNDKEDIQILQSMDLRLHHRDVIPKIIWELFIRRAAQEMIKRVVGTNKRSGIYKITNKETGEAYVGRTVDFRTRFENHLKTAVGLEGAAHATLHTRLAQDGIWNYTFEILEDVDKEHLSERETYYIDLYGTKSQLNMKSGDKNV